MSNAETQQNQPSQLVSAEYADLNAKYGALYTQISDLRILVNAGAWTRGKIIAVASGTVIAVAAVSILSNKAWNALFPAVEQKPARAPRSIPAPPSSM